MDFANFKARKVGVFTDKTVGELMPMKMVSEELQKQSRRLVSYLACLTLLGSGVPGGERGRL